MTGPLISGQQQWVLAAALLQVLYYTVFAAMFKSAFLAVDVKSRVRDLLSATLGVLFINMVAPTWGMAGAALYVDDAANRGESSAQGSCRNVASPGSGFQRICNGPGGRHILSLLWKPKAKFGLFRSLDLDNEN